MLREASASGVLRTQLYEKREAMKIVGVAACTVGIAHTYMAQKAIQDECAARGIECKVEAQGGAQVSRMSSRRKTWTPPTWSLESVDVGCRERGPF